jgi:hypothetical protein
MGEIAALYCVLYGFVMICFGISFYLARGKWK